MFKVKIDSEMLKKYVPDTLLIEKFIYSHYKNMANIKKLFEENQKMHEVLDRYTKKAETQQ